jgi:hypothetical protein
MKNPLCQLCGTELLRVMQMARKYDHSQMAHFGLNCNYCGKVIKTLPCPMCPVNDIEDWVYFHWRCYKKQLKHEIKSEGLYCAKCKKYIKL